MGSGCPDQNAKAQPRLVADRCRRFLASSWWQMVWPNPLRRTNTPLTLWRSLNGIKVLDRSHQSQFLPSSVTARRRSFSGIESRMPRQNWHRPQKPAVIDRHYRTLTARCRRSSRLRRCFPCPCIWRLEDKGTPGAYDPPFRRCCATR